MSATLDIETVIVNISSSPGAVTRQGFGIPAHATEDVGAGFTERIRFYTTNTAAQEDTDLDPAAKVAAATFFSQEPRPPILAIVRVAYATLGADLDEVRAENDSWYGLDLQSRVKVDILAAALWTEANEKLFLGQTSDADVLAATPGNVMETLKGLAYKRTACIYHATDTANAALAWFTKKLAADPDVQVTMWKAATLSGITPDVITDTEKTNVLDENGNVYLTMGGIGGTGEGTLADGNFIDTRISKDWFKARLQERTTQLVLDLSNTNRKIAYDSEGIATVENILRSQAQTGERLKHFRADATTYQIPLLEDIDPADITARELTLGATVILAGAIQKVIFNIVVLTA